jgi:glycosyltransferase involved in cell wall biosynthesis
LRRWIYPTFPRHFKNVEVIGAALEILERTPQWLGEVKVTIAGDESRYARWLLRRFGHLKTMRFIGRQAAPDMQRLYENADGLLFPSKLETWGLPITEAQAHGLPLLVSDLEYAHETVGNYDAVTFFKPDDAHELARTLLALSMGDATPGRASIASAGDVPTLIGWDALLAEVCRQ